MVMFLPQKPIQGNRKWLETAVIVILLTFSTVLNLHFFDSVFGFNMIQSLTTQHNKHPK